MTTQNVAVILAIIRFQWVAGPERYTNTRHIELTAVSLHRPLWTNLQRLCNFVGHFVGICTLVGVHR